MWIDGYWFRREANLGDHMRALLKWVAGIASGIVVGIVVWKLTTPDPPEPRAEILVCLEEFSYEGERRPSGNIKARGTASFRLLNTGALGATATRIHFQPIGVVGGRSLGAPAVEAEVEAHVPPRGVVSMDSVALTTNEVSSPDLWFDEPRYVNVWASAPGADRKTLACFGGGPWHCGTLHLGDSPGAFSIGNAYVCE